MAAESVKQILGDLNKEAYVSLLSKLIGESKYEQNNPEDGLIPEEDRVVRHLLDILRPLSTATGGGPLVINHKTYQTHRGNLIVEYPGSQPDKIVSFVGMHMDVVPAKEKTWDFYPFSLSIEGDKLRGRGTTDCLGHVALVAELMKKLGETKPPLKTTVVAVFIANEENSSKVGVGVDALKKDGYLDKLKPGPLYWVDTADNQPCFGTGGMIPWKFHTIGKLFHSGLPDKAINPLELSMEALKVVQTRFYEDYPPHPQEIAYRFEIPSTMKPTQWSYPGAASIKFQLSVQFLEIVNDVINKLKQYLKDLNASIESLPTRGPVSKYVLPDEKLKGSMTITFDESYSGVACKLDSLGYHVLCKATEEVIGYVKPYSITGSLLLVRELQDEGYDVQNIGYGLTDTYHADNEYCLLSDMSQGYAVFVSIISQLEE